MGKGYAEGSAVEERQAALERGDDPRCAARRRTRRRLRLDRATIAEQHFLGWVGEVDPDKLFASGAAWGIKTVRLKSAAR